MGHHTRVNYSSSLVKVDIYYRITYFPRYILNENFKIKYLGIRNVHHNQQLSLDSGSRNLCETWRNPSKVSAPWFKNHISTLVFARIQLVAKRVASFVSMSWSAQYSLRAHLLYSVTRSKSSSFSVPFKSSLFYQALFRQISSQFSLTCRIFYSRMIGIKI